MEEQKIILKENELKMQFTDEELKFKKNCLKTIVRFWKNKEFSQLIRYAKDSSKNLPANAYGNGDKQIAEIYYLLASAMVETKYAKLEALEYALKSAHFNRLDKNILWLIREIKSSYSQKNQLKRIQIKGKLTYIYKSEELTDIFKTIYTVAAETNEEALEFIKEYEREEIGQSMEIVKVFELGPRPELPKGIFETMKLMTWFEIN
ncbi:MAG: hypothetical protein V1779_08520 [bacterium]